MSEALKEAQKLKFDVTPLKFYDAANQREMMYIYPDTKHWCAGWLLYRHPDGQWVTLRKATGADIRSMSKMVVEAHHAD